MLIFGLGYTAGRLASRLRGASWQVVGTRRAGDGETLAFEDETSVRAALAGATHVLSSIPPGEEGDPVLRRYGAALTGRWLGYLSSTGVYGDAGGAWVDEGALTGGGRNPARAHADADWLVAGARVFRLPGIYGPGRSAFDRLAQGRAHRIALRDQVFSRIHVDDIVEAVVAAIDHEAPAGVYNIADDAPASQNAVIEAACAMAGLPLPPLQTLDEANISAMGRGFYAENRRVANGKAKRVLGWRPRYPDYRAGLAALARNATASPTSASSPPTAACHDQR